MTTHNKENLPDFSYQVQCARAAQNPTYYMDLPNLVYRTIETARRMKRLYKRRQPSYMFRILKTTQQVVK